MQITPGISIKQYKIETLLGRGGTAEVYQAVDIKLNRQVALKILLREHAQKEQLRWQFLTESSLLSQLNHPNIVSIHAKGEFEGLPYFIMEYLPGGTLKNKITGKSISIEETAEILLPIANALNYAHQQGVIHCDIKPSNILFTESGQPVLTDFGIGLSRDSEKTNNMMGSMPYMSPEQLLGNPIDKRTDIYSLGLIFFEMVLGHHPYGQGNILNINYKKLEGNIPFLPDCPEKLRPYLSKAISKEPAHRLQSMHDLSSILTAVLKPENVLKTEIITDNLEIAYISDDDETIDEFLSTGQNHAYKSGKSIFLKWGAIISAAVVLIAGASIFLPKQFAKPKPPSTSEIASAKSTSISQNEKASSISSPENTQTPFPTPTASPTPIFYLPSGPNETFITKDGMEMVFIPEGSFSMGANETQHWVSGSQFYDTEDLAPAHSVYIHNFWMDKTEVTFEMFQQFTEDTGYITAAEEEENKTTWKNAATEVDNHESLPVIYVSWDDAQAYCEWAGKRLPTEAEWEKAARGTDERMFPWGIIRPDPGLLHYAKDDALPVAVGSFPDGASPYGLLDMAGNVAEWTADWYGKTYYTDSPIDNPQGPDRGTYKVVRGGDWDKEDYILVSTINRNRYQPEDHNDTIGFRCVLSDS